MFRFTLEIKCYKMKIKDNASLLKKEDTTII